jgi:glycogen debranching enzyme
VDLTNPDVSSSGRVELPHGNLHLSRTKLLWHGVCYERLKLKNFGAARIATSLSIRYDADFADIFEVRGTRRKQRGQRLESEVDVSTVTLAYRGLDGVSRRTRLLFSPRPESLAPDEARFNLNLDPREEVTLDLSVRCEEGSQGSATVPSFDQALAASSQVLQDWRGRACTVRSSNERFNDWVNRAQNDLHMMTTQLKTGPYPYAGVPWFSTPFGRDGLITALECLWLNPEISRGVLAYLAQTQATAVLPKQDAQPGKILHETRGGEMAALGEVPFGRYYGSVDATPLFVLLAGAYHRRTDDRPFLEFLWPHIEAALHWIDNEGDPDRDGFVEYASSTPQGLANQGWKDSFDAIFHADGKLAEGPIALCEVQGYVYAARRAAARMARALGHVERANELKRQARDLRTRFEKTFWCDDLSTYALALDGAKRPCRVRTSNAGQCLFTGIVSSGRARRLAHTLLDASSFSGWGVRTVATTEARYNPMSYHDGSVWPHDNALIAWGLARYGRKAAALKILSGMFGASMTMDLHRLPELFCGFPRRPGEGPTHYPVACSPQAWAAAAVYLLIQACLGLKVSARRRRVRLSHPRLPASVRELSIRNLRVGDGAVNLLVRRHGNDVGVNVTQRQGRVEVRVVQ